jgi:predicted component of type VI protein secretion system
MAYVVVSFKGQEVGRWPLNGPLTVGRSTECDVVVRDILLSRRHCEIAPDRGGWVACDLGSKNGTKAGRHPITRRGLADGDLLTLGKTTIRFRMGRLPAEHRPPAKRPADPFEALAGTVTDFDPQAAEAFRQANHMPSPRPIPREPAAFARDDLYSLLTEIASSSWDSIYAQASRPKRPIPRAHLKGAGGGPGYAQTRRMADGDGDDGRRNGVRRRGASHPPDAARLRRGAAGGTG